MSTESTRRRSSPECILKSVKKDFNGQLLLLLSLSSCQPRNNVNIPPSSSGIFKDICAAAIRDQPDDAFAYVASKLREYKSTHGKSCKNSFLLFRVNAPPPPLPPFLCMHAWQSAPTVTSAVTIEKPEMKEQATSSTTAKAVPDTGAKETTSDVGHTNEAPTKARPRSSPAQMGRMLPSNADKSGVPPQGVLRRRKTLGVLRSLVQSDPRDKICKFFDLVAQCPDTALAATPKAHQPSSGSILSACPTSWFDKASVFTVWRPTRCIPPFPQK
jgi:hypothetical protein